VNRISPGSVEPIVQRSLRCKVCEVVNITGRMT
jgi:hypothetical protein